MKRLTIALLMLAGCNGGQETAPGAKKEESKPVS